MSALIPAGKIYTDLLVRKQQRKPAFAVLIDPDKVNDQILDILIPRTVDAGVDYLFVGGSLVVSDNLEQCILRIKTMTNVPVVLFPGSSSQVSPAADGLLYLSLISGRNPDLLIGQHVVSAPFVRQSGLEILSTGYMVIDGGAPTTVSYISNASPIPSNKNDIAVCTAMAGEMLGMKLMYLDAGSGAQQPVQESMINAVSSSIQAPLIVGGGITDPEKAYLNCKAGADVVVIGNAIEKDASLIQEMASAIHQYHYS
ncbi:MAG: geranylgeranylglyceryl/heptaprenylglyceryl phosphate synthase [Ferruginibacter sp.]